MLTHLEPQEAEKWQKKGRVQNTVKRGGFWPDRVGRRQGARPLSPTERRETALRQGHGQGAPGWI